MPVRRTAALTVAAALTATSVGSAATMTLSLTPATGITPSGGEGGRQVYVFKGTVFQQQFLVDLADDAGVPVATCLGEGAAVRLVDVRSGRELARATCPLGDGRFHLFPNPRVAVPTQVVATVDANVPLLSTTPVGAARSAPASIVVQPDILDTSPAVARINRFPITGRVKVPNANRAGAVALERRRGSRWSGLARRALPRSGAFRFLLTTGPGVYRIRFVATPGSGYRDSSLAFRIRRTG